MKRHVVLLLMILAFIAGIAVYRAAVYTPAAQLATSLIDVEWPALAGPQIVLTSAPTETAESDVVDSGEADAGAPAPEPVPATFDEASEAPTDTTFDAVPDGSRVRVRSDEELILEAEEIRLNALQAAGLISDNPIPEFLRGRDLAPLVAGEKVVTIPVPVDNWVDLGWGDQVQVEFEQAPRPTPASDGPAPKNFRLKVCDGEIYALPQFAPETGDTVPVCLKLTTKAARELLAIRKNPGTYTVTVTHKFEPVITTITTTAPPASRAASDITFSHEPLPIAPHDEFDVLPHAGTDVPELPVIEPSDAGTVYELKPGGEYVATMGVPLLLEAALPIIRVTGFDQKIIRVTADSHKRLRVLGINQGGTAIKVTLDKGVFPPFNVTFDVNPSVQDSLHMKEDESKQQLKIEEARRQAEAESTLRELYPDANLNLIWIRDFLVLRGTVPDVNQSTEITSIAQEFAPRVLN